MKIRLTILLLLAARLTLSGVDAQSSLPGPFNSGMPESAVSKDEPGVMEVLASIVQMQRGCERGWFSYLEHCSLVNQAILETFAEHGIEFAFPTQTLELERKKHSTANAETDDNMNPT